MSENKNMYSKKIRDKADSIYQTVSNSPLLKGRKTAGITAACLYLACKEAGELRTLKEISSTDNNKEAKCNKQLSKKELGRCYKIILKLLDQEMEAVTTTDYMKRFCSNLGLPKNVEAAAATIAENATENDLVPGKSPISVAAAAIFMASQASAVKKSRKEIAISIGVADVTIRHTYVLMYPRAAELFPTDFVFDTPVEELPLN